MNEIFKTVLLSVKAIMEAFTDQLESTINEENDPCIILPDAFYAYSIKKRMEEAMMDHPFYAENPELAKEIVEFIATDHQYAVIERAGQGDEFIDGFIGSIAG
jgi:hypothetical protein